MRTKLLFEARRSRGFGLHTALWVGIFAMASTGCSRGAAQATQTPQSPGPYASYQSDGAAQNAYGQAQAGQAQAVPSYESAEAVTLSQQVAAGATEANPYLVGYEEFNDGTRVEVVTYVHTYPEPIETYPNVYWSGRYYYNINGSFVYWSPYWSSWCYYWGPPAPLISVWNYQYPWIACYWGAGYYGSGWYWGGGGYYGYHAYGRPPSGSPYV